MTTVFENLLIKTAEKHGLSKEDALKDFVDFAVAKQVHLSQSQRGLYSEAYMTMYFGIIHFMDVEDAESKFLGLYKNLQKMMKQSNPFQGLMFAPTKKEFEDNCNRNRIYKHEDFRLPFSFNDHACGNGDRIMATLSYVTAHYGRDSLLNKEVVISDKDSHNVCTALFQILQHSHQHKIPIGKITAKNNGALMFSCVARKPAKSLMQLTPSNIDVDRLIAA